MGAGESENRRLGVRLEGKTRGIQKGGLKNSTMQSREKTGMPDAVVLGCWVGGGGGAKKKSKGRVLKNWLIGKARKGRRA